MLAGAASVAVYQRTFVVGGGRPFLVVFAGIVPTPAIKSRKKPALETARVG